MLYHAYDLAESATASYRNAASIAPRDFRWSYYLGYLSQQEGWLEAAEAAFQNALGSRPLNIANRVHLAEVLVGLDRPTEAIVHLQQLLSEYPEEASVHAALGRIAQGEGRHEEAIQHLQAALQKVPSANRLHYPLALAYRSLGDEQEARKHLALHGAVGVRPADPLMDALAELLQGERVHLLRGRAAFQAARFQEAAQAFQAAADADPKSARARVNLGTALARMGESEAAMNQYHQAIAIDPESGSAHFNLGESFASRGSFTEARIHLGQAIAIDPTDGQAQLGLGEVLRKIGEPAQARVHYEAAQKADPLSEAARLGEAAALVDLELFQEAIHRLQEALELMPNEGRLASGLAKLLAGCPDPSLRDGKQALGLALRVFEGQKSIPHAETVALALAELGRCEEAAQWQRQAWEAADREGLEEMKNDLARALLTYESGDRCRDRQARTDS